MKEWTACDMCGGTATEKHHVFNKSSRQFSEEYHLTMNLCRRCHYTLHHDYELWDRFKAMYQARFEAQYGHEEFMKKVGRNYL